MAKAKKIPTIQQFNVLGITKKITVDDSGEETVFVSLSGTARTHIVHKKILGIKIATTEVRFKGIHSRVLYVKSLHEDDTVHLAIEVNDSPYTVWELHTDISVTNHGKVEVQPPTFLHEGNSGPSASVHQFPVKNTRHTD